MLAAVRTPDRLSLERAPATVAPRLAWARPFWRPEVGIFLAIWFLLLAAAPTRLFRDPGTFWHIAIGQHILEHGEFLRADPYSFTRAGAPWVTWQWGGDTVMAALHAISGFDGVLVGGAAVIAGLFTWLAHRLMAGGLHWLYAGGIALLAMAVSSNHFHLRPHLGTMVLFGLSYALLVDFEAGRIGIRRLFLLVPLFILWTNIHGGVLGGLGTVALAFLGWAVLSLWRRPPLHHFRDVLTLAVLVVLCTASVLVNPFGLDLPRTWIYVMFGMDLPAYIAEHARLDPFRLDGVMVLLAGAAYAVVLTRIRGQRPRITWLLPLVWLVLSCSRIRDSPLFAIAATLALADLLPYCNFSRLRQQLTASPFRPMTSRYLLLPAAVIVLTLAVQAAALPIPVVGAGCGRLDPGNWPTDLVPALTALQAESPEGTPIYSEFYDGGFLIYHAPHLRVFNDDRCELYGDRWQIEQMAVIYQQPQLIDDLASTAGFRIALVRKGTPLHDWLDDSANWQVIERGRIATLYRRRNVVAPHPSEQP